MAAINEANVYARLDGNDKSGSAKIAVCASSEMFNEVAGLNYQFTCATGEQGSLTAKPDWLPNPTINRPDASAEKGKNDGTGDTKLDAGKTSSNPDTSKQDTKSNVTSFESGPDAQTQAKMNAGLDKTERNTRGWDAPNPPSLSELNQKIGDNDVLYWGDSHRDGTSVQGLNQALKELKQAGVTTVAVEGLNSEGQNLVRDWLKAPNGSDEERKLEARKLEKIKTYLKNAQPDLPDDTPERRQDNQTWRDKTEQLIQAVKAARLDVLGLEPNQPDYSQEQRDSSWENAVNGFLADNPGQKLLIFGGALHFTGIDSFTARLAADHVKAVDLTPPSQYEQGRQ